MVLVGPLGLFVFEAKHHRGVIFRRNGIWAQIKVADGVIPMRAILGDPSAQLSRSVRCLKGRLERSGRNTTWIHGTIVFTNSCAVKAVTAKDLCEIVPTRLTLPNDHVGRINSCLSASLK